ncbi:DUF928 domain-containing protein [Calothrix sp. PCC 7507]|uniref:DUF928 domain-containing protein n=1 Tax=Calothrix sp. PCC 7507 TaxID=99598 RepID=UPI00029F2F9C|nr:DUF928 domain-containing protein [Calothrix sp. PCC 7507]AFY36407.1 protein of unknown function DUF928 [Calothrix sp. PCC 7507]
MTKSQFYIQIIKGAAIIALCASCSLNNREQITAGLPDSTAIKFAPPPPPTSRGEPTGRAQGGAGRGCEPTALVPLTKSTDGELLWGLTVAERPTFWFGLPRNLTTKDAIAFVLRDELGKEVYQTMFKTLQTPQGVVNFAMPKKVPPLKIGKLYGWSFSIYCDFQTVEDKPGTVQGKIQRVPISATLKNQLVNAKTPEAQAIIYAKNGIWFDALTTLGVDMRGGKEKAIASTWDDLLHQVNLEKVASLPIVPCCNQTQSSN